MAAKDITIRLQAIGGDQSAAEIQKVSAKLPELSEAQRIAADAAVVSTGNMQAMAAAQGRVSQSSVNMRSALSNVGFQIQDFAVQTSMGTSAIRAFSQQGPQLLSALGPWGVALGTIVALGAPLAAGLIESGDAASTAGEAYQEAADKTVELARAQQTEREIAEQSSATKAALSESLREITTARFGYNESLRESIDLLAQEQAAQNEIAAAMAETEIAAAEGDPLKQEQIRNRARQEAQQRELQQNEERRKALADLAERRFQQQESIRVQGGGEAERLRQAAAQTGEAALTEEQKAQTLAAQAADLQSRGQRTRGPAGAELRRQGAEFQRRANEAKEAGEKLRSQQASLTQGADDAQKSTQDAIKRLDDEMGRLFDEIRKLETDARTKTAIFGERDKQGSLREDQVRRREFDKQERERQRAESEARRRREQDLTGQAESAEGRLDTTARSRGTNIRRAGLNSGNDTLAGIGKSLMDGTDAGELQRIGDLIAEKQRELGAGNVQALRTVLAELQKQAAEIAALKGQIKQSRAGK